MISSAIERRDSLDPDNMDLAGALTSSLITEADLLAGRWDGARLHVTAVNWADPPDNPVFLVRGELGSVESDGLSFSAELRGPATLLEASVVEETSPECRAELGDRRCRVDLAGRRIVTRIVSSNGMYLTVESAPRDYGFGLLRWLDGANAGLAGVIALSSGTIITLREPPPFLPEAGAMTYPASSRLIDRANGAAQIVFGICQIGSFGLSRPTTLTIPLT